MVYSADFTFDLQRFDATTWTLTYEESSFKLTSGDTSYTGSAGTIINNAATGKASDDAEADTSRLMLDNGDTIQLGGDISYSGTLKFNSGISLTLNLTGGDDTEHSITSSSGNAIIIGDSTEGPSNTKKLAVKNNKLTIIGNGTITGATNGIEIIGPQAQEEDLSNHDEYAQLIVGREDQNDAISITANNGRGITGNGSAGCADITINTVGTIQGSTAGIYNPQIGTLTINSGIIKGKDDSTGSGVAIRAGELVVNGGTIQGGSGATSLSYNSNASGTTTSGAGIAIDQHITVKDITVTINDGDISGFTALAVTNSQSAKAFGTDITNEIINGLKEGINAGHADYFGELKLDESGNPIQMTDANGNKLYYNGNYPYQNNAIQTTTTANDRPAYERIIGTITVNVKGGKLESTSTATSDNATSSQTTTDGINQTVRLETLTGKNAILNADARTIVSIENTEIIGALAATYKNYNQSKSLVVDRTVTSGDSAGSGGNGYQLGEGNTYRNFTGDSTDLFPYYYAATDNAQVIDVAILGTEGWNKKAIDNNWDYVVAPTGTESVGTALTQLIADSTKGAFSLTSGVNTAASIVSFDANNNLFKDLTYKSGDETKYYTVIDAGSANSLTSFNITGNERITSISGGAGNDSIKPGDVPSVTVTLEGGDGDDLFFFDGNSNTITDFGTGNDSVTLANSKFRPANADFLAAAEGSKITIDFGGGDALMFENLGDKEVSLPGGHIFATRYHAFDKQIALTSVQTDTFDASATKFADYATIDAAEADKISVKGNSQDNRIIGSNKGGSLNGGTGNDRLIVTDRNSSVNYLFEHTAGKDSIEGFDDANDTLAVDATKITEAKGSGSKLTLTIDKTNSVVLKSDVDIEKVNLQDDNYLTSSGYFATDTFKLFANAKGKIDLSDTPYKGTGITTIDATDAKKQSVTLTADSNVTAVSLAANKKKDLFVYGGGTVSISGYEAGTDRLNIADIGAVSLFTVDSTGVSINAGGKGIISIQGAADQEVLIRDGGKSNSFSKFVFHDTGVLYNKAKKPTEANIYSNVSTAGTVQVADSIKKIFLQTGVSGASIQAGNNKATLDASEANGVTLIGNTKNNKFVASTGDDMFVYKGGKDNIEDFDAKDEITLDGDFDLNGAKISASNRSLKFKFTTKNALTLKSDSKITSASINGGDYSFSKNAVGLNGVVSLTSQFSGSYKIEDGDSTIIDGHLVKKNLTFKGTSEAESLSGGQKKTTFKGGGGDDIFVGGDGKDIFFYAKTDSGKKTIENFDFGSNNDKIKIANGTIKTISKSGNDITFSTNGGSLTLKDADKNVLLKANNTFYWFDDSNNLITADTKVSNAQAVATEYAIIELGYSTNLVKTNLATKAGEFTFSSSGISKK